MKHEQTPLVIVFTTSYLPLIGGAEIAVHEIIKRRTELRFLIITSRTSGKFPRYEVDGHVTIKRLGFGTRFDKWLLPVLGFFAARRAIRSNGRVVLWGMMISQGTIAAYFLKKVFPRISLLVTLQEGDSPEYLERGRAGLIGFFWRRTLAVADHVTVISVYLGGLARAAGYTKQISIIPNGVDEHFVSESFERAGLDDLKQQLGILTGERVVISVSRLAEKNGLADLIEALLLLLKKEMKVKLFIAGAGEEKNRLQLLVKNLRIGTHVVFLGAILHEDLLRYYRMSDIFARPSRSEGLGISFLEAMGAGIPVVATPVGGILDFLEDTKTGIFVEPANPTSIADGIERLLTDDTLRKTVVQNARELVIQKYLWVDISKQMGEIFLRVTS
jgi:glycosyltransferase involved in cell wall biosynthesis